MLPQSAQGRATPAKARRETLFGFDIKKVRSKKKCATEISRDTKGSWRTQLYRQTVRASEEEARHELATLYQRPRSDHQLN